MSDDIWLDDETAALLAEEEEKARERIETIRRGDSTESDTDLAEELVRWSADTMTGVSTGRLRIDEINDEYRERYRALAAVLRRLGIENPIPFPDLWAFYEYWSANLGGYGARRAYVVELL